MMAISNMSEGPIMKLFTRESGDPKTNAQRNLMGRTHYVDDATLRFHASRVTNNRNNRRADNSLVLHGSLRQFRLARIPPTSRIVRRASEPRHHG